MAELLAPPIDPSAARWRVRRDVEGDTYRHFLEILLADNDRFGLVWRQSRVTDEASRAIRRDLGRFQLAQEPRSRWLSVELGRGTASVHAYEASPKALPILMRVPSLYAWRIPLPQDLHFWSTGHGLAFSLYSPYNDAHVFGRRTAGLLSSVIPLERY